MCPEIIEIVWVGSIEKHQIIGVTMVFGIWSSSMTIRPDMNDLVSTLGSTLHHHVVSCDGPDLDPVSGVLEVVLTKHEDIRSASFRRVVVLQEHLHTMTVVLAHLRCSF